MRVQWKRRTSSGNYLARHWASAQCDVSKRAYKGCSQRIHYDWIDPIEQPSALQMRAQYFNFAQINALASLELVRARANACVCVMLCTRTRRTTGQTVAHNSLHTIARKRCHKRFGGDHLQANQSCSHQSSGCPTTTTTGEGILFITFSASPNALAIWNRRNIVISVSWLLPFASISSIKLTQTQTRLPLRRREVTDNNLAIYLAHAQEPKLKDVNLFSLSEEH